MLDRDGVPADGAKSDAFFEHLLGPDSPRPRLPTENRLSLLIARLLPGRTLQHGLAAIVDHEERAALVCAVTALCVVSRQYVAVGDPELGYITLPPLATSAATGLQPWAWEIIRSNLPEGGQGQIVVEPDPT